MSKKSKLKVVKLKEGELSDLINKILNEEGALDELVAPLAEPTLQGPPPEPDVEVDTDAPMSPMDADPTEPGVQVELTLAQNPDTGDVYILKDAFSPNPEILGIVKNAKF